MMDDVARTAFAEELALMLSHREVSALAASTVGGILLARDASDRMKVPLLVGKQSGKKLEWVNVAEFQPAALRNVILVDDVLTTPGLLEAGIRLLKDLGVTVTACAVAVDRSQGQEPVIIDGVPFETLSLISLSLNKWNPGDCPLCPTRRYVNLYDPEGDFIAVILSMPPEMAEIIIRGYRQVYELQRDLFQVQSIDQWRPWLPSLLAGLPSIRVGEDSGLAQFIRSFVHPKQEHLKRRRILTELFGHLMVVSQIRVESRSLGCSVIVGDVGRLQNFFQGDVPLREPTGATVARFDALIPYYDALRETDAVFLFDKDGGLFGIKRLSRLTDAGEVRGNQLLRQATEASDSIGFVVRRERRAVSVYRDGRLEAVAELSEKTGCWEFTSPRPILEEIDSRIPGMRKTLEVVLEVAREMSTRGYGGLFVVGDAEKLGRGTPKVVVREQPISLIGTAMVAEIAKLDGAVFVSRDGDLQQASTIIINTAAVAPPLSHGVQARTGGSRRQTADRTSRECPSAAVVCVSQNGTIEIWVEGISWPISEAVTGVLRA
jgi:orotate phosphoribosyltransferase/DNA integrity scanning protein DisA with diadenylate cyclase activity